MIRSYFRVIHITSEKIIIGNTQQTQDDPGTSSEDPLKDFTSGTYRGPSGGSQGTNTKIDDFMKKKNSEIIVLVLHICFYFLQEEQIFKSSKWERPQNVYGTQLWNVHGTK